MPFSSTVNRKVFTGNGVTTVFPFDYYFLLASDLVVLKTEIASGAATLLALNVDYSVTGAGDPNGGNVTLVSAPSAAYKLTIYRDPPLTQEVDFQSNDALPDEQIEEPVDKLTMIAQRLKEMLLRAVRLSDSDVSGADVTLPAPEAGKAIRWKNDASGLENYTVVIPTGAVSTATTTSEGIVELATQAEVNAGADAQRPVTPSTLAGSTLAARVSAAEVDIDSLLAFNTSDNILINGNFRMNSRVVTTNAADDTYTFDRWNLLTQTGTVTIAAQVLQEPGTPRNIRIIQAQATAQRVGLEQIVQDLNCQFMRGRDAVFGARVRSSVAQTIRYAILEWTGTANVVTSDVVNDWTSSSYTAGNFFLASNLTVAAVGSFAVSANTWTDLPALTGTLSNSLNNLIAVIWSEAAMVQNATLDIARAQLVAGTTLPAFKNEDHVINRMRCSKYFYSSFGFQAPVQNIGFHTTGIIDKQVVGASAAQLHGIRVTYPFDGLRSTPTITLYNPLAANAQARNVARGTDCTLTTVDRSDATGCVISLTTPAGSAAGDMLSIHLTADAEL